MVVALLAVLVPAIASASLDNKGTEFLMGFIPNYSTPSAELHLTSDVSTDVTVTYPVNSPTFTQTVAVTPGSVTIVTIPTRSRTAGR